MEPIQRGNIRLAATVLLLRDASPGPEVFMVKRPGSGVFPDLHVFPGGKVDEGDHLEAICSGLDDATASARLGVAAGGLRYWVAAIRECFEECGVLLATRDGVLLEFDTAAERQRFTSYRRAIEAGDMTLPQMCRQEGLLLACDRLAYFSHWLTPESAPKRFDTRFFTTTMPTGQHAIADTGETAEAEWVRPEDALARHGEGAWQMIHPTLVTLGSITGKATVADILAGVRAETHLPALTDALRAHGMRDLR